MGKKQTYTKSSDADKPWNRKSKGYQIDSLRQAGKTIIVFCEGQSEKLYFEAFPVLTLTVKCEDMGGESKLKLVKDAEVFLENQAEEGKTYEEVWCVFDMDVHKGEKEFADFDNAINKAKKKGYNVAYSNDAYELWYYLHYQYTDQCNHRTFYFEQLSRFWNISYEGTGKSEHECKKVYKRLEEDSNASQANAIKHAKKLHADQQDLAPHQQNPVTTVYLLVELLNENLRP